MANNVQSFLLANRGALTPAEGFRCTGPLSVPNGGARTLLDLSAQQQSSNFISGALAIYVNNGGRSNPLILLFSTGSTIAFPANAQGYVNILQTNPIQIYATNSSPEGAAEVMFTNVQMPAILWPATTH